MQYKANPTFLTPSNVQGVNTPYTVVKIDL
nr:MAG TPA: hypothetical protein [Caudoviricetes sp.]